MAIKSPGLFLDHRDQPGIKLATGLFMDLAVSAVRLRPGQVARKGKTFFDHRPFGGRTVPQPLLQPGGKAQVVLQLHSLDPAFPQPSVDPFGFQRRHGGKFLGNAQAVPRP
ncbi:MAG: hypothetical protein U5J62_09395 [Desulfurivibrio sp.]|nr:hypothetical protein [Desulfurivibrio sp.]